VQNLLSDLGGELHRWPGQIQDTIDFAGVIGRNPGSRRTYVVTGNSGQGMTHGSVAGILISDLISKGYGLWTDVYDPSRKPLKAAATYLRENNFAEYVLRGGKSAPGMSLNRGRRHCPAWAAQGSRFRDANGESSPRPGASRSPIGRLSLSIQSS
jgi:hypothetical protein